ncbi:hypothetical protein [Mycobacterium terramassiliense]|uniref:hypothetical protein n=1 Tax=Mycobacterium terramassiliense TaxID=1841859 RepID=UPI001FE8B07A|nr:hypothetical protein [Mycobacterium terramassiliense]
MAIAVALAAPAVADASTDGWGLNGTFKATSVGNWAQTNDVYHDETGVTSTWTIATTCSSRVDCSGQVNSDAGWTAPIYTRSGEWLVKRALPHWEHCRDDTTADGLQTYRFYPADFTGRAQPEGRTTFIGWDKTVAPSGACGINQPLVINMPFQLAPIS